MYARARQQISLPAADEADMPFLRSRRSAAAAIRHGVKENAARFRHIDWLGESEGGGVLHHAARIARGELNVGDDGIVRVFGVELPVEAAAQRLVLAGGAEGLAVKGRRLALLHYDAYDAGIHARTANEDRGSNSNLLHGGFSFSALPSMWIG